MAGNGVQLAIKIAGQVENSYKSAINSAKSEASGLSKALQGAGTVASNASGGAFSKIKSHLSSFASHVVSLGGVVTGVAATVGTAFTFKNMIENASEAAANTAQMSAVLKSTGGVAGMTASQLEDLATAQAKVTKYDDDTTKQAENMLLTFTNIHSNVFPQTIKAAEDMATAMKMGPTQAAQQLGKALNDPATGYSKLQRVGVTFTASQIKAIKSMQAAGNTAGAQKIILGELNKEFGGSAEAAGKTFPGQMAIAKNAMDEIGETVGTSLMPAISKVVPLFVGAGQKVAGWISSHQADISNAIGKIADFIGKAVQAIEKYGPVVMSVISRVVQNVISTIGPVVKTVLPILFNVIKNVVEFIVTHKQLVIAAIVGIGSAIAAAGIIKKVNDVVSKIKDVKKAVDGLSGAKKAANIFQNIFKVPPQALLLLVVIAAVAAAAYLIIKNWGPIKAWFKNLWTGIKNTFAPVGAWFKNVFNVAKNGVMAAWSGITGFFGGIWNGIKSVFSAVGGWFRTVFGGAWNGIKAAWSGVTGFFSGIWGGIVKIFSVVITFYVGIFKGAWNGIKAVWGAVVGWFQGIWNGIKSAFKPNLISQGFSNAWSAVKGAWNGAGAWFGGIWNSIKSGFQKLNPVQWGKDLIDGIARGIRSAADHVKSAVGNVAQNIRSFLHFSRPDKGPLRDYEKWMPHMMTGLATGIAANKYRVANAIHGLSSDMTVGVRARLEDTIPAHGYLGAEMERSGSPAPVSAGGEGGGFTFAPKYVFYGPANREDVKEVTEDGFKKFKAYFEMYQRERARVGF